MFNLNDMMGKMQEMQQRLQDAKMQLDKVIAEAEAGGGMVRAKANGNRKLVSIKIDPEIIDKNDPEMLEDLVIAAVNRALDLAEEKGKEEMKRMTKDILPNIPGMDMGKIGF